MLPSPSLHPPVSIYANIRRRPVDRRAAAGPVLPVLPVLPVTTTTTIMALSNDPNYQKLQEWYRANASSLNMREMFAAEPDRFSRFRWEETLLTSA